MHGALERQLCAGLAHATGQKTYQALHLGDDLVELALGLLVLFDGFLFVCQLFALPVAMAGLL